MGSLPRRLWSLLAPHSGWRVVPELEGLEPGHARRTWRLAYDELRWDSRSQLGWLAAGGGVSAATQWPELQGAPAWAWVGFVGAVLYLLVELDLHRRARHLVLQRLDSAERRGRRLASRSAGALLLGVVVLPLAACDDTHTIGGDLLDGLRPTTADGTGEVTSPQLHRLLDEGRFAEVHQLVEDREATPRLSGSARALFEALSFVGHGDCQAAVDLAERSDDLLSERHREVLLSRSVQLLANWSGLSHSPAPFLLLDDTELTAAESRWDAAHCLLDHAGARSPGREAAIERCRDRIDRLRETASYVPARLTPRDLRRLLGDNGLCGGY